MRLLTFKDLKTEKGIRYSDFHLSRLIKAGKFPRPIKFGGLNHWVEDEVDKAIRAAMAAREAAPSEAA